jgi:hypothetical protein
MNNQEEILVRQSKMSGRRVVLLYWFAIVFVGTAAAAGVGAGVLNPKYSFKVDAYTHDDKFGDGTVWHPDECQSCHPAEYEGWNQTLHSYLFAEVNDTHVVHYSGDDNYTKVDLEDDPDGYQCCHFTIWVNDTVPAGPPNGSYWDYGVTCAACHEDPDNGFDPYGAAPFGPGSYPCGGVGVRGGMPLCHIPRGVSQFDMKGPHSKALGDLLASDETDDSCLHCMTGNGLIYGKGPNENSSDEYGALEGITCYTCHDPHAASNELYKEDKYPDLMLNSSLRAESIPELCGSCHTGDRDSSYAMITDTTVLGPHSNFDCTVCHGYELSPANLTSTELDEASFDLDHKWALKLPDACGSCHLSADTNMSTVDTTVFESLMADRMDMLEGIQGDIATLVTSVGTEITAVTTKADTAAAVTGADEDELSEMYLLIEEAKTMVAFVEADPSGGFHNPDLAEAKLQLALTKLAWAEEAADNIISPPVTPTTTTEPDTSDTTTTGAASAVGLLAVLGILSAAVLLRKKRR